MKKIWTDPVWSKVIASVLITIGFFCLNIIYGLFTYKTVLESIKYFWTFSIPLGPTFIVVVVIFTIVSIIKKISKKQPSKLEKLKQLFHENNTERIDNEAGVTFKYNAFISSETNFPFITDLRVYCTENNHPMQLLSQHSGCPVLECKLHGYNYSTYRLKTQIETGLLEVWEKMKKGKS